LKVKGKVRMCLLEAITHAFWGMKELVAGLREEIQPLQKRNKDPAWNISCGDMFIVLIPGTILCSYQTGNQSIRGAFPGGV